MATLGPLEAWRDGKPLSLGPPARRTVLGLLLVYPRALVRRDTIIDVLWGQHPPRTAVGLVQAHVSRLRQVLEPPRHSPGDDGVLHSVGGAYRLSLSDKEMDLLVFRDLAAQASTAWAHGDYVLACELYERAVGLWRGDPLTDVDLLSGDPGITLLRQQLAGVLLRYAEAACALGQYRRVLPRLQALAAAEPLNESPHAHLMIALAGSGQQAAAIRVYEDARSRLDRELGLYPGEELVEAHMRVLRQDIRAGDRGQVYVHSVAPADVVHVVPRQLPAASRYFTGRIRELDILHGLLERNRQETDGVVIAALTGMAGIGKTALAVYWAHHVADRFPDGQLFADLRGFGSSGGPASSAEAVCGFLTALGVPPARIPPDPAGRAALYRSLLADRRMLIVLDNVQDAEQVRSLLPGSPQCLALITSRAPLTGLAAGEGAHLLPMDVLTDSESRDLLTLSLGVARATAEPAAVSELIGTCARLPEALCNMAAWIAARPGLSLTRLAAGMRDAQDASDVADDHAGISARAVALRDVQARRGMPGPAGDRSTTFFPATSPDRRASRSVAALPWDQ